MTVPKQWQKRFKKVEHLYLNNQLSEGRPFEFRLFYWFLVVYLCLMTALYWFTAQKLGYWTEHQSKDDKTPDDNVNDNIYIFALVLLQFVPNILNILIYALIYVNLERLFKVGRIQSSGSSHTSRSAKKCLKCLKVLLLIVLGTFVVTESILLGLVLLEQSLYEASISGGETERTKPAFGSEQFSI